ncbi:hypothetical protein BGZ54_001990 [Gamsiella multidivaricata]|nr:hypothetical protein BGZ54_001990 [Gamsiella multidivaricata]
MSDTKAVTAKNGTAPDVLIAGAGLGGLLLAALLERVDIPYQIFERASELRSLGAAISIGPSILPVFEQLGLMEELKKISLPCNSLDLYNVDVKKLGSFNLGEQKATTGYNTILIARPQLYELLRKQVPAQKISLGKKVLRIEESDGKVRIFCADNSSYSGDILVGADGAYSAVRQSLYKNLDKKELLPKSDLGELSVGYISLVGISEPQDPEKYPQLKDDFCHFAQILGHKGMGWSVISVPNNQICWGLGIQLSESDAKEQQFRNSEWGPESSEAMIQELRDLPCAWGGTMREIVDATPRNLISKVFLEAKLFSTWYHGRTVLLGDGAVNAMHDAVVLANCLYNMSDSTPKCIEAAFQDYYRERYPRAEEQYARSEDMSKVIFGHVKHGTRFFAQIRAT